MTEGSTWLGKVVYVNKSIVLKAVLILIMLPNPSSPTTPGNISSEDMPFLTNSDAIDYIKSSKLMVIVPSAQVKIFKQVVSLYGKNATCINDSDDKSQQEAQAACAEGSHVVAINIGSLKQNVSTTLRPYTELALEYNYSLVVVNEPEDVFPQYIGWHLNEADSCMLELCAHALLDDLLRHNAEFCSDFRNFSMSETISEMLKYYQLASSNHNGMLHCTAKYFGMDPPPLTKAYYQKVKENITMTFQTTVIGLVITPRTFGARLKLSPEQLHLWGGDDDGRKIAQSSMQQPTDTSSKSGNVKSEGESDLVESLTSSMAQNSIKCATEEVESEGSATEKFSPRRKKSSRYFPNCQASLVYLTEKATEDPDFHPVSGPGRRAHMTLGVAPGVSAVTTGYDLLEVVELETLERDWPTYKVSRGWLRDYGEGRWVLYMKNNITVNSLFAGVYSFA